MAYSAHQPTRRSPAELRAFFDECHRKAAGNIVTFGAEAIALHDNRRKNGDFYTEHLKEVAGLASRILLDTKYRPSGIAGGYMHDMHEEIRDVWVDPPRVFRENMASGKGLEVYGGKIVLNQELQTYGWDGDCTGFYIWKLTRFEKEDPLEYIQDVTDVKEGPLYNRSLVTSLLKFLDRFSNGKDDHFFYRGSVGAMFEDALAALERDRMDIVRGFLRDAGVSDWFKTQKRFKFHHLFTSASERREFERLFIRAMGVEFEDYKQYNALESIQHLLPKAEWGLLVFPGLDDQGRFDLARARDNGLYDYDMLREMFKVCYVRAIKILEKVGFANHPIYRAKKPMAGRNTRETEGYRSVVTEISHQFEIGGYRALKEDDSLKNRVVVESRRLMGRMTRFLGQSGFV